MIDAIFVPRGAEERAVRRAVARARVGVHVVTSGIGSHAASRAALDTGLAGSPVRVLVTGLCGLLSPAFVVGDALVYQDIRRDGETTLRCDGDVSERLAARLSGAQTGVHALDSERVVTSSAVKAALVRRFGADAVDMESYALVRILQSTGARVAVIRVGSDAATDDLPDLDRAFDGSGGLDGMALALAMLRRPRAGLRLARNGTRALAALQRVVYAIVAPAA